MHVCRYMREITDEHLAKYFRISTEAFEMAASALDDSRLEQAKDFLDMAQRYIKDAHHFHEKGEDVLAFAALNYAHGWLDAGARIQLFKVHDSRLFTVDDE